MTSICAEQTAGVDVKLPFAMTGAKTTAGKGVLITSDTGLLAYRELDDALGLSAMTGDLLVDARTGGNGRRYLQPRQNLLVSDDQSWL
jgi:hypothetical protein